MGATLQCILEGTGGKIVQPYPASIAPLVDKSGGLVYALAWEITRREIESQFKGASKRMGWEGAAMTENDLDSLRKLTKNSQSALLTASATLNADDKKQLLGWASSRVQICKEERAKIIPKPTAAEPSKEELGSYFEKLILLRQVMISSEMWEKLESAAHSLDLETGGEKGTFYFFSCYPTGLR